jgi:hypothetical protein
MSTQIYGGYAIRHTHPRVQDLSRRQSHVLSTHNHRWRRACPHPDSSLMGRIKSAGPAPGPGLLT